jgi:Cu+-exporting ATPase
LAGAIIAQAEARDIVVPPVESFDSPSGKGAQGIIENLKIIVGNRMFLQENAIDVTSMARKADELGADGATVIFVGIEGRLAGILALADPIKATTPQALEALKAAGVRIVMLTGDNLTTAGVIAERLGIEDVEAEILPEQKSAAVSRFKRMGRIVAMAGDGVNDAPALAAADVGIAMGSGTDVAMESAGITLLKGDLVGIVRARILSKGTMRNIRQNLFFAFVYNAIGIPIAAGALYPEFGILLSPMFAAAAMALSSVSVIGNALRLRWIVLPR